MSTSDSTQLNSTQLNSTKDKRGFTLIELLVVISILAILSVIGFTAFNNVQKGARDAKRRSDIDAIAKALEVNNSNYKPCENGTFLPGSYCSIVDSWFIGGGMPKDPGFPGRWYCYAFNSSAGISASVPGSTDTWANVCPTGWNPLEVSAPPQPNAYFWKICAWLENNTTFCKSSQQ